jgi:hypothetical protein
MIQFNLLPDVKLDFIKAQRVKRTVVGVTALITAVCVAIATLLFVTVAVLQRNHINNINTDIKSYTKQITDTPDLNKVLTIQNQLNSLKGLHDQKPVTDRLFVYLTQLVPAAATVSDLKVDFELKTIKISGKADSVATINKFADTLKFTTYKYNDQDINAFSSVVLSSFTLKAEDGEDAQENGAGYELSMVYDQAIFDAAQKNLKLKVPSQVTTRSETEKPTKLFEDSPTSEEAGGAQ